MAPGLLLLLLCLQACDAGPPALSAYRRIHRRGGQTLSMQCSYKSRRNQVETKVWCKVRNKKCEVNFRRPWVTRPHYRVQDDAQGKVISLIMADLRPQDSGRYWCMRVTAGSLFPMEGFLLEVSPGPVTQRPAPVTRLTDHSLKRRTVISTGRAPTSGPDTPFPSAVTAFTPGSLPWASLRPSTALGTSRPASVTGSSLPSDIVPVGPWPVTMSPADTSRHGGSLPTSGTCCDQVLSTRLQEPHLTALVVLLTLLPAPVMLAVVYKFWKKKYRGSYSLGSGSARAWAPSVRKRAPVRARFI
ncbi:trem-like transcript 2 protein isoform X2 [Cavia porcellus]|uniref:Immunoglobulin domain-containing protein n=1 Tax=Cavia porcellus TaxID=10141 RepID=H0WDT3_CAVPO|nr:trem-like transcript 2 protein [Cavia porcellus]